MLQPLPRDVWSLSLFPFQLANGGNNSTAGRLWTALQMPCELVVLALMLIQGSLGARSWLSAAGSLKRGAQLCPLGSKSFSAASSQQHKSPCLLHSPRVPKHTKRCSSLERCPPTSPSRRQQPKATLAHPSLPQPLAARSLGSKRPDWAQAYDHISVLLAEHTEQLMLMGTRAVSAGTPSCSVGGLP